MIRSYEIGDKTKLVEILKRNVPSYFDPSEVDDFMTFLEKEGERYFTFEYKGEIVGGAGCLAEKDTGIGLVRWIFFDPSQRGSGLGKLMMEHCLRVFKADPMLQKLVVQTSQLAYRFFEKFGYKLIKVQKDFWGPGLDLYHMERELHKIG